MEISADGIKQYLRSRGIDLIGIADARKLILASPPRPATDLMPAAKSVIVMAVAHSLGAVYAPHIMLWTRNKMQASRLLDQVAEEVGRALEAKGFLTLPVSADKPVEIFKLNPATGKKFRQTRVLAHLSLKHAAVSCGMGQIGRSNLLLTPEFGPHQRLCAIITEAALEPDEQKDLDLCDNCGQCEQACPSGALHNGGYDVDPCFVYWAYGFKKLPPENIGQWPAYIKMLLRHNRRRDIAIEFSQTSITDVDQCIECMRACPVGKRWENIRPEKLPPQKSEGNAQD
jgi:epoxyqueuosine reductase QueG